MTTSDFYFWLALISFLAMAISWISFARISMTAIEKRMAADGLPRPCLWDGVGARAIWIAAAISFPLGSFLNPSWNPSIDATTIRRYATKFDQRLGLTFALSMYTGLAVIVVGVALGYVD
ncbi:MAG: hypothetical protein P8144_01510 [Gammaproteobacteria bacterium]|jgi:hypothetical protein